MGFADYLNRRRAVRSAVEKRKLDSFLVTNETNVSYLTGFSGHDSVLLISPSKEFFITDSRYAEDAKDSVKGLEICVVESSTYKTILKLFKKNHLKKPGFESMNLPYGVASTLAKMANEINLVPVKNLVEDIRAVKDGCEIALIKKSIGLAKKVMAGLVNRRIKPGVSEEALSRWVEIEFIKHGATSAFKPIIASGANSSRPHAMAGGKKIAKNDFVMVDIGCNLNGYNSDLTRTVLPGRVNNKFKKIYNIVSGAQEAAMAKIKPGASISEVDHAARGYISKQGFGNCFGHSLGHGVGMDVHEEPSISGNSEGVLRPGMVFTIEPAIYIPKFGGVRIEDMVLVTDNGCEILTR